MSATTRREQARELRIENDTLRTERNAMITTNAELIAEVARLNAYADKLVDGLPDGILPKDVELLRDANAKMATQVNELTAEVEGLRIASAFDRAAITPAALANIQAELTAAKQCDLCAQPAEYHVCQPHLDDLRGPDVHSTAEGDYPNAGAMVIWSEPGDDVYIGGFDLTGWFAQGGDTDSADPDDQPTGPVLWCLLLDLDYLYEFQHAKGGK